MGLPELLGFRGMGEGPNLSQYGSLTVCQNCGTGTGWINGISVDSGFGSVSIGSVGSGSVGSGCVGSGRVGSGSVGSGSVGTGVSVTTGVSLGIGVSVAVGDSVGVSDGGMVAAGVSVTSSQSLVLWQREHWPFGWPAGRVWQARQLV